MKALCFIFIVFTCSPASAQQFVRVHDSAFVSVVKLPSKEPFDTAHAYKKVKADHLYIISEKDLYDIFGYNRAVSMQGFNFTDYHILGRLQCRQCEQYCEHDRGETNCHRNACNRVWTWVTRENEKAFIKVPAFTMPLPAESQPLRFKDTVIMNTQDSATWFTTGRGDCFARFQYELVADRYYPVLLLKEWNRWGGCRAGGTKPAKISFIMPGGIKHKVKHTILLDR